MQAALALVALTAPTKVDADDVATPAAAATLGAPLTLDPARGAPLGPFLLYPELTLGAVATDNIYPSATRRMAATGARFAPRLIAVDNEGVRQTSVYLNLDADWFPGASHAIPQAFRAPVTASIEARESWSPTPQLLLQAGAAFTRQSTAISPAPLAETGLLAAPSLVNLAPGAAFLNRAEANVSGEREFEGGFFVRAGGQAEAVATSASGAPEERGRDLFGSVRVGRRITPTIEAFAEGDEILRRGAGQDDVDIARAAVGLSSDLVSLFRGEIHAGYQRQSSPAAAFAPSSAPSYGVTLSYYPTPWLTLSGSLDRAYAFAILASPAATTMAAPDLSQARLKAEYTLPSRWTASGSLLWARTGGAANERLSAWSADAELRYGLGHGVEVALIYTFARTRGAAFVASNYDQNVGSLAVNYRY